MSIYRAVRLVVRPATLAVWGLLLFLTPSHDAYARSPGEAAYASLAVRIDRIEELIASVEDLPEWERDGLLFRVDEEILALHDELAALSRSVPGQPDSAGTHEPAPDEALRSWMDRALSLSALRVSGLGERIAVEAATYDEFSDSSDTIVSKAFVQELRRTRLQHLSSIAGQLNQRSTLGLPEATKIRAQLDETLDLGTERLVGQIRLDAMTLQDLRRRIAADPTDETLRSALRAVERKQTGNLETVGGVIALLSQMGRNTTELRALQAQQRGLISAEILDSDVFMSLLGDRLQTVRESSSSAARYGCCASWPSWRSC